MASANDIVRDALFRIGASSDINPASPEMINTATTTFFDWLDELYIDGVDIGYDPASPPTPSDELGNIQGTTNALKAGAALQIADAFNITPTVKVVNAATKAMSTIYALTMRPRIPSWPETLPVGAGNMRAPRARVYMQVPEFYDEYNPDGLSPEPEPEPAP